VRNLPEDDADEARTKLQKSSAISRKPKAGLRVSTAHKISSAFRYAAP